MEKRGQISTEYLIVVGFVVFLVISILGVALFYSSNIRDRMKSYQLERFSEKIISTSEAVFYAGSPSKATVNAYLPSGVSDIRIQDNYLVFNLTTSSGLNVISFKSNVPISLDSEGIDVNEGLKVIKIEIDSNIIKISQE